MTRIFFIKLADAVFGKIICRVLPSYAGIRNSQLRTTTALIIRPGGIGDAVLLLPAIKTLKNEYPDIKIDILAEQRNREVFSMCDDVHRIFLYEKPRDILAIIRRNYDIVIDTEQWHRLSSVVARLVNAPVSIGFRTNERRNNFNYSIPYFHDNHEIISFMQLLSPIVSIKNITVSPPFLTIPPSASDRISRYLAPLRGAPIVAVFPGGSLPEKRWDIDRFQETICLLIQKGYNIVLIGGKSDTTVVEKILTTHGNSINLCGMLSLIETAAVLRESCLLISGDSGIMHIASGLGTRVLALFGPSNSQKWGPRSLHSHVISKKLECSPCSEFGYTSHCLYNVACMRQITVDEVFAHALRLLKT